ncbi:hypothetical protein SAMN04489712_10286 [Thermomonospora echinospora]|uniref:Uncharacterized protein n=1 Tax=Thermomonospora echinospora TaxID=1992 RepID=A0A1H5UYE2_9ACTN|nr:hypothetical protein [Thermomonospora echinospora]SEF79994.1 hypothetical protein SAMN04489712_10286 [Thermomonospora echinospora]
MPSTRMLLVGAAAAAGLAGAVLTVLGAASSPAGLLTLFFLLTGPALATWPLLARLTPAARAIVSGTMTFVVNTTVAQVMLSLDLWSPRGGVAAVLAICLLLVALDVALTHRATGRPTPPAEEDDWLFQP